MLLMVMTFVLIAWLLLDSKAPATYQTVMQTDNSTSVSAAPAVEPSPFRLPDRVVEISSTSTRGADLVLIEQDNQGSMATLLTTYTGSTPVMDDTNGDEWDEERYLEQRQQQHEAMSEGERNAQQHIEELDYELAWDNDHLQVDKIFDQIETVFIPQEDDGTHPVVDLTCSKSHCRVAFQLVDEAAQYTVMDQLTHQIEGWQQSVAKVNVKADDSRLLIVYMQYSKTL